MKHEMSLSRNDNCKGCSAYVKITPKDVGTEVIISEVSHAEACEAMNGYVMCKSLVELKIASLL